MGKKQAVKQERPDLGTVYENTKRRFKELFADDGIDSISISFSGGKDSNTVLRMALDALRDDDVDYEKPIHLLHIDDEVVLPETEEFVKEVAQIDEVYLWWVCLPTKYRNGNTNEIQDGWWYPWHPEKEDMWIRDMPREFCEETEGCELVTLDHERIQETVAWDTKGFEMGEDQHANVAGYLFAPRWDCPVTGEGMGITAECTGIRTHESMTRYQAIVTRGDWRMYPDEAFESKNEVCVCHPIYDWTDRDLWHAHKKFDWPYNDAYDKQRQIGLAPLDMRTAHPYSEEAVKNRNFEELREAWPEHYEKAKGRVPGSDLGFELGGQIIRRTKRDEQTWKERCAELIANIENEKIKEKQQRRVQRALDAHAEHATEPLPETGSCPLCGQSWANIAGSLQKGDLKGRGGL
jgi:predicted phosphoadenosine phosphosulfate sulfurtransferase